MSWAILIPWIGVISLAFACFVLTCAVRVAEEDAATKKLIIEQLEETRDEWYDAVSSSLWTLKEFSTSNRFLPVENLNVAVGERDAAIAERDTLRAEVERLTGELAQVRDVSGAILRDIQCAAQGLDLPSELTVRAKADPGPCHAPGQGDEEAGA